MEVDGSCHLYQSCENFPSLWNLTFKFQVEGQENYVLIPLAALAIDYP